MSFVLYPAIDLKGGQVVRLKRGEMDQATVFGADPAAQAAAFACDGFPWLHVVDLDGAFHGVPAHTGVIAGITAAIAIPVQVGGGLRSEEQMQAVLDAGAARFVVGTRACADPGGLARLARRFGERLVVGIDARDGMVATEGWAETSEVTATELALRFADAGVAAIIFTDIARDGMLAGINVDATAALGRAVPIPVIASGGAASLEDIRALKAAGSVAGCILGRALYDGRIEARAALELAAAQNPA